MEDYPDPYQCVLEIRSGTGADELQGVLLPLLVGIDPAFELISLSNDSSFSHEYTSCGRTFNDNHFHELDEGEYIESPALSVLLFLDERSQSLTPKVATEYLHSEHWQFHHKIELSKLQNGIPKTIAQQEYYQPGTDFPLWSVGSIHYGNEHLRFNIFTRRFAAMVEFYRVLTGKEGECTRSGFCMFPIYSQPGLDIQLALKRSERIIPRAIKSAALRFKIRNVKELKSITAGRISHINGNVYCMLDPDGNLVILEQTENQQDKNESLSPRGRTLIEDRGFEDSRSIADSYDSGRYSVSSEHGDTDVNPMKNMSKYHKKSPMKIQPLDNGNSESVSFNENVPKPAPRTPKIVITHEKEDQRVKPTPTKRKSTQNPKKVGEEHVDSRNDKMTNNADIHLSSRHYKDTPSSNITATRHFSEDSDGVNSYSEKSEEDYSEPTVSVRDRAKAINRKLVMENSPNVNRYQPVTRNSDFSTSNCRQQYPDVVMMSQTSPWQKETELSPRQQNIYRHNNGETDGISYRRTPESNMHTPPLSCPPQKPSSPRNEWEPSPTNGYVAYPKQPVHTRTASSDAILTSAALADFRETEDADSSERRVPAETMNKLVSPRTADLEHSPTNGHVGYHKKPVHARTASSDAILSSVELSDVNGSEGAYSRERRVPTETMNKLLKSLPTRLDSTSPGKKPYIPLDQRIRRALNYENDKRGNTPNSPTSHVGGAALSARF